MNTTHIQKDLSELLGLHELSEEERNAFLEDVGNLIVESACTRLVAGMTEGEKEDFDAFLSAHKDADTFIPELEAKYPAFTDHFKEEVLSFREEAQAVMGSFDA